MPVCSVNRLLCEHGTMPGPHRCKKREAADYRCSHLVLLSWLALGGDLPKLMSALTALPRTLHFPGIADARIVSAVRQLARPRSSKLTHGAARTDAIIKTISRFILFPSMERQTIATPFTTTRRELMDKAPLISTNVLPLDDHSRREPANARVLAAEPGGFPAPCCKVWRSSVRD
jgi:hypothetical protein